MGIDRIELPDVERVRELLDYDPETGVFTWRVKRGQMRVGDPAGRVNTGGYIQIKIDGVAYVAHRLAWLLIYGAPVPPELGHRDGNPSNNRISNLEEVTHQENQMNLNDSLRYDNTSGYRGVTYYKATGKWLAQITVDQQCIHLGYFWNKQDAAAARAEAEKEYGFYD